MSNGGTSLPSRDPAWAEPDPGAQILHRHCPWLPAWHPPHLPAEVGVVLSSFSLGAASCLHGTSLNHGGCLPSAGGCSHVWPPLGQNCLWPKRAGRVFTRCSGKPSQSQQPVGSPRGDPPTSCSTLWSHTGAQWGAGCRGRVGPGGVPGSPPRLAELAAVAAWEPGAGCRRSSQVLLWEFLAAACAP